MSSVSCFDARRMETCHSLVTRDVVVIYTLDWCQKRNLTILTSHHALILRLQTTDGKL